MLLARSLPNFVSSQVTTVSPKIVIVVASQRTYLKNTGPSNISQNIIKLPAGTQPKSTLTLESSTLDLHDPQKLRPSRPSLEVLEKKGADDSVSIESARLLPRFIPKHFTNDPHCNRHLPKLDTEKFKNNSNSILEKYSRNRKVDRERISKYMQLLVPRNDEDSNTNENLKPLVMIYPWLGAKEKHIEKYTKLYTDLGINVLRIDITIHELLRPVPRSHVAAYELLDYLSENPQWHKLLVHGMSVGAYGFMEVMAKMEAHEDKYLDIRPRFIGQIWDSPCDLPGLKEGVARAITDSRKMQGRIMELLEWFLHIRYEAATKHYIKTQDMYYKNYLDTGGLFLYSRADRVASPRLVTDAANQYHNLGYEVFTRVYDESQHVGHYAKYSEDYRAHSLAYLQHIGMLDHAGIKLE